MLYCLKTENCCLNNSTKHPLSFLGYWSINDWYDGESFGETKINLELFPSLGSIGMPRSTKPSCRDFFVKISSEKL